VRSEQEANIAIKKYADIIRRICFIHLKNYHDTENIFQEVFLKYILTDTEFESNTHEKAWLIRVAINSCKDLIKSFFRQKVISIESLCEEPFSIPEEGREVLYAVLQLKEKYRDVIYLFYYEGYKAVEIARILNQNENTIYTWLSRAKAELKAILGKDRLNG
jgi:RNA polymerase sigma-70 factor (ECF subfamily)